MSGLGFCAPCAAAVINPAPLLGEWKIGFKPLAIIVLIAVIVGIIAWRSSL